MNGILFEEEDSRRIERVLLKDNTADLLRDYIVSGKVEAGSKIVERQVSAALGVSRMPIRDAMIKLEQQGLVVSRSGGRYVIKLSAEDARQLNQVRTPLEVLAVELAVANGEKRARQSLDDALRGMREACGRKDQVGFIRADLEIHSRIWRASKNDYLQKTLATILGPLQVVISNSAEVFDWTETLEIHADLVEAITRQDRDAALAAIRRHMESITR